MYRFAHVGNLRTFLLSDLIRRVATLQGLHVTVVQNITDVGHMADDRGLDEAGEDKILSQGNELGGGTPEVFAALIKTEAPRWGKVVRDAKIEPE